MVCPSYSNFSVGITLLHHNGSTVHGWEKIQQGSLFMHMHFMIQLQVFFGRHFVGMVHGKCQDKVEV